LQGLESCDPSSNPPHSPDARPSRLGYVDDQDLTEPKRHCIGPRVKLKNELKRAREERNKFAKRNKQLTSEVAQLRKINDECDASRNIVEQVSMQRKEMCETLTEEIRRLKTSQASLTCEKRTLLERIKITEERSRVLSEKNATLEEETADLAEEKVKLVEENSELMWNAELQADRMGHENTQAHFGHLANDSSLQLSGSSDTVKSALEMHLSSGKSSFNTISR
jgi:chromosome segregation ATPase